MSHRTIRTMADAEALAAEFLAGRKAWAGGLDLRMEAGDDDRGDDDSAADDAAEGDGDQGDDDAGDGKGADQLGDAGKKALDAMKARWKTERDQRKELERQLAEAAKPAKDGDAADADAIQAEADRKAQTKANDRILRSEVKAAAAGKLADPADAHRFLDLSQFEVDNDGNVDEDEIAEAIDDLIKRKPYLAAAAQGGQQRRFQGSADGGARKEKSKSLQDQIEAAEKAGDIGLAIRLKARQVVANNR